MAKRIGVFVCHCGLNIAGTVDVEAVVREVRKYPGVAHAQNYIYMCSDPGQDLVRNAIIEHRLDGIVMANCSPSLHEKTFRRLAQNTGLNPYFCEVANIREYCSWPHSQEKELATQKAIRIIQSTVEKVRRNLSLFPAVVPITKRALVIGGGVAGIQAALDIARGGYDVVLVEKSPWLGGHIMQLSRTFPTLEWPQSLITPQIVEVLGHPRVTLYSYAEVEEISGYVGNFKIKIRQKPKRVDWGKCTLCGLCFPKCPREVDSEFDRGLAKRKAIYLRDAHALPSRPVIDEANCLHFWPQGCTLCAEVCPEQAIVYDEQATVAEEEVGGIIVATGYDLYPRERVREYEIDPDIIDGLQFERLMNPGGPTEGQLRRPSDGKVPRDVVFIQCTGSRDPEHGLSYCSRVCCLYTAKQATAFKKQNPDGQAYVFYMDIRTDIKGGEEFVQKAMEEDRVLYLRGRVSRIFRDGDKLEVWGVDTITGENVSVRADMVVLALGMTPSAGAKDLLRRLNIISDEFGFVTEAHPKLRPVETLTVGIFPAGTAQAPRDISDTVSQASGAASKVLSLFSRKELLHEPVIAYVNDDVCAGCGTCVNICAYKAIELDPRQRVARVNEAICEGCGACAATCPSGAMQHKNFSKRQFLEMISVATGEYE
jgi:heterodisulfide reductase subunit A